MFWLWFTLGLIGFAVLFLIAVTLWGRWIRVAEYEIPVDGLDDEFDGFRISVISDLHDRCYGKENQRLVSALQQTAPDLVVTAGDMHEDPHSPDSLYALFRGVSQDFPVTYKEGNHDLRRGRGHAVSEESHQRHLSRISEAGAILLNDTVFPVERNGKYLLIYGQSWGGMLKKQAPDFPSDMPTVCVCHDPLQFDHLDPLPDLVISGHVHGGILRLPGIGPVFAPGNGAPLRKRFRLRYFFPKYSRGLYQKGKHTLAVTQGLGFAILPIRLIRPEILVLTLKSSEKLNIS